MDKMNHSESLKNRLSVSLLLLVLTTSCVLPACAASARKTITARADALETALSDADCNIRVPAADAYLEAIATNLRASLIALDTPYLEEDWVRKLKKWNVYDRYDVHIVNSPISNASTLGKDFALVHSRLLLELPKPEYLAALLAHEYAHISEEHTVEENVRYQTTVAVVTTTAMLGAAAQAYSNAYSGSYNYGYQRPTPNTDWGQWMRNVMKLYSPFRKKDEIEADLRGLEIYLAAGYNPTDYLDTFKWLLQKHGDVNSPSHPRMSKRVDALEQVYATMDLPQARIHMDHASFQAVKDAVRMELLNMAANSRFQMFENMAAALPIKDLRVYSCGIDTDFNDATQQYFDLLKK